MLQWEGPDGSDAHYFTLVCLSQRTTSLQLVLKAQQGCILAEVYDQHLETLIDFSPPPYTASSAGSARGRGVVQGSTTESKKAPIQRRAPLPDTPLLLAVAQVSRRETFLSSGLDPAQLAAALFPIQHSLLRERAADGRDCVRRGPKKKKGGRG